MAFINRTQVQLHVLVEQSPGWNRVNGFCMERFHGSRVFSGYIHEQIELCLCEAALCVEYTLTTYCY